MNFVRTMLAVLLVAVPLSANAAGALSDDLSWTLPTQRVDGTPLPIEEIAYTEIELWRNGVVVDTLQFAVPTVAYTYVRELPPNYEMCYAARVADTEGQLSDWTDLVCKTVRARPNPPGLDRVR